MNIWENRVKKIETIGFYIALYGLVTPFLWIGIMKFAHNEAVAIEPLLRSAPWTSWLLAVFGVQGASNLIGAVEVFGAVLLALQPIAKKPALLGGVILTGALVVTTSFLFTNTIAVMDESGILFTTSLGSFLIKDIALLGASILVTTRIFFSIVSCGCVSKK